MVIPVAKGGIDHLRKIRRILWLDCWLRRVSLPEISRVPEILRQNMWENMWENMTDAASLIVRGESLRISKDVSGSVIVLVQMYVFGGDVFIGT
jgi:hypothetical protein